jgi:hypothetical protein
LAKALRYRPKGHLDENSVLRGEKDGSVGSPSQRSQGGTVAVLFTSKNGRAASRTSWIELKWCWSIPLKPIAAKAAFIPAWTAGQPTRKWPPVVITLRTSERAGERSTPFRCSKIEKAITQSKVPAS